MVAFKSEDTIQSFHPVVVGMGEVLWDVFPDKAHFGGAPANFACHAAALGARAAMVSCVGVDTLGDRALEALRGHGVDTESMVRDASAPTGTVQVTLDSLGTPKYVIKQQVAWDRIPWTPATAHLAARTDAVCFGSLAQRNPVSRFAIHRFLESVSPACIRVFDVNLRQQFYTRDIVLDSLRKSTVLKLNDEELPVVAGLCGLEGTAPEQRLRELLERFTLDLAVLTLGANGALLVGKSDRVYVPAARVEVSDTVGAGDAFTATVVMGLLSGADLPTLGNHAAAVAGYVCSQPGAVPPLPEALRKIPQ